MSCCRCAQTAEAWMSFDYDARLIEIHNLPDAWDGYGGYAMCTPHANRLRPPVGWNLTDARDMALTLFPLAGLPSKPDTASPSSDVA
ncbi:MAG: DUF3499 family protein [Acidimicrobiia bacterium]|nr:DUF3499 family protein [Acidimicrobiia bacterium]